MADIKTKITSKITVIKDRLTASDVNNVLDHLIQRGILTLHEKIDMDGKSIGTKLDLLLVSVFKADAGKAFLDILKILNLQPLVKEINNSAGYSTKPRACHSHKQGKESNSQNKGASKHTLDSSSLQQMVESCTKKTIEHLQQANAKDTEVMYQIHAEELKEMKAMNQQLAEDRKEMSRQRENWEKRDQQRVDDLKEMNRQRTEDLKIMEQHRAEDLKQTTEMHERMLKEMEEKRSIEAAKHDLELQKLNDKLSELTAKENEKLILQTKTADEHKNLQKRQKELERVVSGRNKPQETKLKSDANVLARRQKTLESEIHNLKEQKKGLEEKIEQMIRDKKNMDVRLRREKERVENLVKQIKSQNVKETYTYTYGESTSMYGKCKSQRK